MIAFVTLIAGCGGESAPPGADGSGSRDAGTATAAASVRVIRIVQHDRRNAFDPSGLAVSSGDAVRFVLTGGRPESVVFDDATATPEAAEFIRENSLNLGVLLIEPGQTHEVSFQGAPPGSYPFRSIPHADQGMVGLVVVTNGR